MNGFPIHGQVEEAAPRKSGKRGKAASVASADATASAIAATGTLYLQRLMHILRFLVISHVHLFVDWARRHIQAQRPQSQQQRRRR
jgi:hypothetical protein